MQYHDWTELNIHRFVIGREKPGEQSEVAQLIQQTLEQERWQREMMEQRYNQYMDEQEVRLSGGSKNKEPVRWLVRLQMHEIEDPGC